MPTFRKKPIVIEAFQMTKERRVDNSEWPEWLHRAWNTTGEGGMWPSKENSMANGRLCIGTLEGVYIISWGDWIIQGIEGEIYPCKPDIFRKSYEEIN